MEREGDCGEREREGDCEERERLWRGRGRE